MPKPQERLNGAETQRVAYGFRNPKNGLRVPKPEEPLKVTEGRSCTDDGGSEVVIKREVVV